MRTHQAAGKRRTGARSRLAVTAAAAMAVLAAAGGGVGNAGVAAPSRATFDYIGQFANLPSAPPGTPAIGGTASMVVTTRATTTGIAATGLDPKNVYIGDVHDKSCFIEEGGGRFLFDPKGPQAPPNAIWIYPMEVGEDGSAYETTISPAPAGPRAKSLVIHLLRAAGETKDKADPPKLACADLARVTS